MAVRTRAGRAARESMEKLFFERLPGYGLLRGLTQRLAGDSEDTAVGAGARRDRGGARSRLHHRGARGRPGHGLRPVGPDAVRRGRLRHRPCSACTPSTSPSPKPSGRSPVGDRGRRIRSPPCGPPAAWKEFLDKGRWMDRRSSRARAIGSGALIRTACRVRPTAFRTHLRQVVSSASGARGQLGVTSRNLPKSGDRLSVLHGTGSAQRLAGSSHGEGFADPRLSRRSPRSISLA